MPIASKPIFVIPLPLAGMTASTALTSNPVASLGQHRAIGTTWRTTGTGNHWARGSFASSQAIDFLAIIGANAQAVTNYRLRLGTSQAQVDGTAPYDSGVLDFYATAPAATPLDGLYHSHLELPSVVNATWWRIDILDQTTVFEASMVVMGKRVQPSRYYNYDTVEGVEDMAQIKVNNWAVIEDDAGLVLRTLEFSLAWINETEFETNFRPMMQRIGVRQPIYCCFDPTASSYRQARTYYGILRKALAARGRRIPYTYQQDFSLLSFI